jgi:hypothetical protein
VQVRDEGPIVLAQGTAESTRRPPGSLRGAECPTDLELEIGVHESQQVRCGAAARQVEEGRRRPPDVEDLELVRDQHADQPEGRKDPLLEHLLHVLGRRRGRGHDGPCVNGHAVTGRGRPAGEVRVHLGLRRPAPIDLVLAVGEGEQRFEATHSLRLAEDEHAAWDEGVVERSKDSLLQRRSEVDEEVAATDEVDARERRIAGDVVAGEDAAIPQQPANVVPAFHGGEEPIEPLRRHLPTDCRRVCAAARDLERGIAQIAREELDDCARLERFGRLQRADRHRVGFLAGGAPRHPEAKRVPGRAGAQQAGEDGRRDGVEDRRVAKEARDVDQDIFVQPPNLFRLALKEGEIGDGGIEAMTALATADPPDEGRAFVPAEVHSGGVMEERGDFIECGSLPARRAGAAPPRAPRLVRCLDGQPCERPRNAVRGQDQIGTARVDGGQRHPAMLGHRRILREGPTPGCADRGDPARSVRCPRESRQPPGRPDRWRATPGTGRSPSPDRTAAGGGQDATSRPRSSAQRWAG